MPFIPSLERLGFSGMGYKPGRRERIENIIKQQAKTFNVRVYAMAVNNTHIHILLKLYTRDSFKKFVKAISGIIARITLGAEKGKNLGFKFWKGIPFSRIVSWAKDYFSTKQYILCNELEALGVIPYLPRSRRKAGCRDKAKYKYHIPIPEWL